MLGKLNLITYVVIVARSTRRATEIAIRFVRGVVVMRGELLERLIGSVLHEMNETLTRVLSALFVSIHL